MIGSSSTVYRRVSRSFSAIDSVFGWHTTPPLAPPYGRPTRAFFHVWIMARAMTSSMLTAASNRMPPLNGPSALLCWQRYPVNTLIVPSSIRIGQETVITRLGLDSTVRQVGSRPIVSYTRPKYRWAFCQNAECLLDEVATSRSVTRGWCCGGEDADVDGNVGSGMPEV
jgi:hypothetical protein